MNNEVSVWQGVVFEPNGVERIVVLSARTERGAKLGLTKLVKANRWAVQRKVVHQLRGSHAWHIYTWTRRKDGTTDRVKVERL